MVSPVDAARSFARSLLRRPIRLRGPFANWAQASLGARGYDEPAIIERMKAAAKEVSRSDGALQERDGVLFSEPITPFPLAAHVLAAALESGGEISVVDFGGALGSTFWQCKYLLRACTHLEWKVIERTELMEAGRAGFETSELKFYDSLEEATSNSLPDVVVLSGVLQYLDDPYGVLDGILKLKPRWVIHDRHPFVEDSEDLFGLQMVPAQIYRAELPFRAMQRDAIARCLGSCYTKVADYPTVDPDMMLGHHIIRFRGEAFRRISEQ